MYDMKHSVWYRGVWHQEVVDAFDALYADVDGESDAAKINAARAAFRRADARVCDPRAMANSVLDMIEENAYEMCDDSVAFNDCPRSGPLFEALVAVISLEQAQLTTVYNEGRVVDLSVEFAAWLASGVSH